VSSILFINRVYPPDSGATGRVLEFIARGFVSAGWTVTVLCTAASTKKVGEEVRDGIRIVRVGIPFSKKNLIARAFGYAVMIPTLLLKALKLPRHDVVVTKTDPPMLMLIGPLIKWIKRSRTIHWAQDLYPEVAVEAGVFQRGGLIESVLRFLSSNSLQAHDAIIAVGRCMKERLEGRGIPASKVIVIPNIGIESSVVPLPRIPNLFRKRYALGESFTVMYSGNMGRAHEFATILDAARILQESGEGEILFLFVGDGPLVVNLRSEMDHLGLKNVRFLPGQPESELSESLAAGDLHLVTMRSGMEGLVVPSKFYGVVAAGRPCLFVGPEASEVAMVIRDKGVGAVIAPGAAGMLTDAILKYRAERGLGDMEGKARRVLQQTDALSAFLECASGICQSESISLS